jgi:hypothetical protein
LLKQLSRFQSLQLMHRRIAVTLSIIAVVTLSII